VDGRSRAKKNGRPSRPASRRRKEKERRLLTLQRGKEREYRREIVPSEKEKGKKKEVFSNCLKNQSLNREKKRGLL